ncbi:MAG TPA: Hsp20/alpha crystallin family protein [Pyrinomonadaceae bacterium]|nr:Hsp20/alpha crystallin family protein [Pyrinomonadaceae bacterium]
MFTCHVHDLRSLQNEVNRLFSSKSDAFADEGIARGTWNPSVDIYENKDRIVIKGDLPGMTRDDIHLTFENNVLTLSGERRFEKKDEADNYHRVECSYGTFSRSFAVQQAESIEGVTAEYNNGILRIDLPKHEEVKARRIEIVGGESRGTRTIDAEVGKTQAKHEKTTAQAARANTGTAGFTEPQSTSAPLVV